MRGGRKGCTGIFSAVLCSGSGGAVRGGEGRIFPNGALGECKGCGEGGGREKWGVDGSGEGAEKVPPP